MRERPEEVSADNEAEAAGLERKLFGVGRYEMNGQPVRLVPRLDQHGRREIDAGDMMPTRREFHGEEAGSAAGVERMEHASSAEEEIENAVPGGALRRRANTVAEVLIEVSRSAVPVGRDPALDVISSFGGHMFIASSLFNYLIRSC